MQTIHAAADRRAVLQSQEHRENAFCLILLRILFADCQSDCCRILIYCRMNSVKQTLRIRICFLGIEGSRYIKSEKSAIDSPSLKLREVDMRLFIINRQIPQTKYL